MDGGETVVSGAGRTHPDMGGKGLMNYLQLFADDHVQRHLPKPASRLVYTAYDTEGLRQVISASKQNSNLRKAITMKRVCALQSLVIYIK